MALTKRGIVDRVHLELGVEVKRSAGITGILLEIIKATLASGEEILISGFGKLCVKPKNERKGHNPATGDQMMLKSRRVVTFKCSTILREKVNGK
jgi:integration host factor subunit alpha